MPMQLSNIFPLSGESLVKSYYQVFAQQSKTNESSRVLVLVMIVRAPATPICDFCWFFWVLREMDWFTGLSAWWTRVAPRNLRNHTPPKAGSKASSYGGEFRYRRFSLGFSEPIAKEREKQRKRLHRPLGLCSSVVDIRERVAPLR